MWGSRDNSDDRDYRGRPGAMPKSDFGIKEERAIGPIVALVAIVAIVTIGAFALERANQRPL